MDYPNLEKKDSSWSIPPNLKSWCSSCFSCSWLSFGLTCLSRPSRVYQTFYKCSESQTFSILMWPKMTKFIKTCRIVGESEWTMSAMRGAEHSKILTHIKISLIHPKGSAQKLCFAYLYKCINEPAVFHHVFFTNLKLIEFKIRVCILSIQMWGKYKEQYVGM